MHCQTKRWSFILLFPYISLLAMKSKIRPTILNRKDPPHYSNTNCWFLFDDINFCFSSTHLLWWTQHRASHKWRRRASRAVFSFFFSVFVFWQIFIKFQHKICDLYLSQRNDTKKQDEICLKHPQQGVRNHLVELVIEEIATLSSPVFFMIVIFLDKSIAYLPPHLLHQFGWSTPPYAC